MDGLKNCIEQNILENTKIDINGKFLLIKALNIIIYIYIINKKIIFIEFCFLLSFFFKNK